MTLFQLWGDGAKKQPFKVRNLDWLTRNDYIELTQRLPESRGFFGLDQMGNPYAVSNQEAREDSWVLYLPPRKRLLAWGMGFEKMLHNQKMENAPGGPLHFFQEGYTPESDQFRQWVRLPHLDEPVQDSYETDPNQIPLPLVAP